MGEAPTNKRLRSPTAPRSTPHAAMIWQDYEVDLLDNVKRVKRYAGVDLSLHLDSKMTMSTTRTTTSPARSFGDVSMYTSAENSPAVTPLCGPSPGIAPMEPAFPPTTTLYNNNNNNRHHAPPPIVCSPWSTPKRPILPLAPSFSATTTATGGATKLTSATATTNPSLTSPSDPQGDGQDLRRMALRRVALTAAATAAAAAHDNAGNTATAHPSMDMRNTTTSKRTDRRRLL